MDTGLQYRPTARDRNLTPTVESWRCSHYTDVYALTVKGNAVSTVTALTAVSAWLVIGLSFSVNCNMKRKGSQLSIASWCKRPATDQPETNTEETITGIGDNTAVTSSVSNATTPTAVDSRV